MFIVAVCNPLMLTISWFFYYFQGDIERAPVKVAARVESHSRGLHNPTVCTIKDLENRTSVPPAVAMLPVVAPGDEYIAHATTLAQSIVVSDPSSRTIKGPERICTETAFPPRDAGTERGDNHLLTAEMKKNGSTTNFPHMFGGWGEIFLLGAWGSLEGTKLQAAIEKPRPEVGPLDLVVSPSDLKDHGVQQWCATGIFHTPFFLGGGRDIYDISMTSANEAVGRYHVSKR